MKRYELQMRMNDEGEWRYEAQGDSLAEVKSRAKMWVAEYRVIDHQRALVRGLDVPMTGSNTLADGGWRRL